MAEPRERCCANCFEPIAARAGSGNRGPDIAWFMHCRSCAELVADQMELVAHQPGGAKIDILRCRTCGCQRSCRPGWLTRCMMCLDDRSSEDGWDADAIAADAGLVSTSAEVFDIPAAEVSWWHAAQLVNYLWVADKEDRLTRPGWTILATDIYGLPWAASGRGMSHGTWASHDICGQVRTLTSARPECSYCPPDPESRSHRAQADDPHLLYLVRYHDLLKFGHGTENRVKAHLRGGCVLVQALRGTHRDVVAAEASLKRRYRDRLVVAAEWNLPATFGTGSEVVEALRCRIDLRRHLVSASARDVTGSF